MAKDTKEKILDAAEFLFSKHGIGATSIRAIIAKAKVNIAAIHYHFGCKQEVVNAVFFRRINPVNEIRMSMLDEIEAESPDNEISVKELVTAFLLPVITQFSSAKKFKIIKGLFARMHSEPDEVGHLNNIFDDVFKRFFSLFCKVLPHHPRQELMSRFTFMIGVMGIAFLNEHIVHKKNYEISLNLTTEEKGKFIIQFVTAGFEAPVTFKETAV